MKLRICLACSLVFLYVCFSCNKIELAPQVNDPDETIETPPTPEPVPPMLDYGDSIFYVKGKPGVDEYIAPKQPPGVKGKYVSWPAGLVMDETTGRINLSLSPHGISFTIGFINISINDTTLITITISGVNYRSGIYVLENNDTLAVPYYNESISLLGLLGLSDDNDYPPPSPDGSGGGNDKAEFDDGYDDDNGNGHDDEPPLGQRANDQNVRVRTTSGVINLKKSVIDGAFGPNPKSGDMKQVRIYYRLNDNTRWALQYIDVTLYYYEYESDIPSSLLSNVRKLMNEDQARASGRVTTTDCKPRPPQIIITRYAGTNPDLTD
jgi:hypothetical protein